MLSFVSISLVSLLVMSLTCLITYEILGYVWGLLPRLTIPRRLRVPLIMIPIFAAHIINIWVYAAAYLLAERFGAFGRLAGNIHTPWLTYESFVERLYFSASIYTSLGLGDIVPSNDLRMLASAEVLNGLVMIGWTVSFTYLTMERFWSQPHRGDRH